MQPPPSSTAVTRTPLSARSDNARVGSSPYTEAVLNKPALPAGRRPKSASVSVQSRATVGAAASDVRDKANKLLCASVMHTHARREMLHREIRVVAVRFAARRFTQQAADEAEKVASAFAARVVQRGVETHERLVVTEQVHAALAQLKAEADAEDDGKAICAPFVLGLAAPSVEPSPCTVITPTLEASTTPTVSTPPSSADDDATSDEADAEVCAILADEPDALHVPNACELQRLRRAAARHEQRWEAIKAPKALPQLVSLKVVGGAAVQFRLNLDAACPSAAGGRAAQLEAERAAAAAEAQAKAEDDLEALFLVVIDTMTITDAAVEAEMDEAEAMVEELEAAAAAAEAEADAAEAEAEAAEAEAAAAEADKAEARQVQRVAAMGLASELATVIVQDALARSAAPMAPESEELITSLHAKYADMNDKIAEARLSMSAASPLVDDADDAATPTGEESSPQGAALLARKVTRQAAAPRLPSLPLAHYNAPMGGGNGVPKFTLNLANCPFVGNSEIANEHTAPACAQEPEESEKPEAHEPEAHEPEVEEREPEEPEAHKLEAEEPEVESVVFSEPSIDSEALEDITCRIEAQNAQSRAASEARELAQVEAAPPTSMVATSLSADDADAAAPPASEESSPQGAALLARKVGRQASRPAHMASAVSTADAAPASVTPVAPSLPEHVSAPRRVSIDLNHSDGSDDDEFFDAPELSSTRLSASPPIPRAGPPDVSASPAEVDAPEFFDAPELTAPSAEEATPAPWVFPTTAAFDLEESAAAKAPVAASSAAPTASSAQEAHDADDDETWLSPTLPEARVLPRAEPANVPSGATNDAPAEEDDSWLMGASQLPLLVALSPIADDAIAWLRRATTFDAATGRVPPPPVATAAPTLKEVEPPPPVMEEADEWHEGRDVLSSPLALPAASGPGRAGNMPRLSFFLRTPPSGNSAIPLDRRRVSTFFKAPEQEDEVTKWLQSTTPVAPRAFGGTTGLSAVTEDAEPHAVADPPVAEGSKSDAAVAVPVTKPARTTRTLQFDLKPRPPKQAPAAVQTESRLAKPSASSKLPTSSLKRPSMLAKPANALATTKPRATTVFHPPGAFQASREGSRLPAGLAAIKRRAADSRI